MNSLLKYKKANPQKLLDYGFTKEQDSYILYREILNGEFVLKIEIKNDISTELTEKETGEIYTLHLIDAPKGAFSGKIREEHDNILEDIVKHCFDENIFKSEYSHKIIEYLRDKYKIELEYLWEKFPDNAVFRRKDNQKWFGIILTVQESKLGLDGEKSIEVLDIKATPEEILKITDNKKYFKGYHMNKKYWLTILLDGSVDIEEIYERIDKSYQLASK